MVRDPRAVILSQRGKWTVAKKLGLPLKEIIRSFFNYHPITMSILWNKAISAGFSSEKNTVIPRFTPSSLRNLLIIPRPQ